MYTSFYTAAAGAAAQQARMDVTANNLANVNTAGFKPKNAVFSQLMYYNMNGSGKVSAGSGAHVEKTDTIFSDNGFEETNGAVSYTHLDVYKRQRLCFGICGTAIYFCCELWRIY